MMTTSPSAYFLLVDDLEENLLALEALLRRPGLAILKAKSGQEALELLLMHDFALALIDIQMPVMDGFELAELMRGREVTRRIPIIFVTAGVADRQRRFRGYDAGAVDFLNKPIEPHILRSKADVFFELYRQRQEVASQRDELKAATERIQVLLEESNRQAEALRDADRRKDEFLAMLAHELRNPLAPIRNAVELLSFEQLPPNELRDARDIIGRQVSHMARIIDDLLDVARIVRGKVELRPSLHDIVEVVRHTAEDYRPTLTAGGLTLELSLPEASITVDGDPTRLSQVVGNLLHNAGKFTPAGGSLHVSIDLDAAAGHAEIAVRDTGIGFHPEEAEQMFEPFSQIQQNIDRGKGGLGLGLALAKGLIDLHGGTIQATSPGPNRGATFTIRIPVANEQQGNDQTQRERDTEKASLAKPLRILVVEDNADAARMLQVLLTMNGHQVEVSSDGEAGLHAVERFKPDVVLSDLGLPGAIDGYELARRLRTKGTADKLCLVALSGYGHEADRQRARDAGFHEHLVKPVVFDQLVTLLNEARRTSE